jgi:hypothetical protein
MLRSVLKGCGILSSYRLLRSSGLYFGAILLCKKSIWARQLPTGLGSTEYIDMSSSQIEVVAFSVVESDDNMPLLSDVKKFPAYVQNFGITVKERLKL